MAISIFHLPYSKLSFIGFSLLSFTIIYGVSNLASEEELKEEDSKSENIKPRGFIITTWRSGSSFLAQVLNSHPETFHFSEPLNHLEVSRVRDESDSRANTSIEILRELLNCRHEPISRVYPEWPKGFQFGGNLRMRFVCGYDRWKHNSSCLEPSFLDKQCRKYPIIMAKSVRLALSLTDSLLRDTGLNLKVLYLVRDPRGTMNSRRERNFCFENESCSDPEFLCQDLVNDYYAFLDLKAKYRDQISFLRYEDLLEDIHGNLVKILQFFNIPEHEKIWKYIDEHTNRRFLQDEIERPWNTFRDTNQLKDHWKVDATFNEVDKVQRKCQKALHLWGYVEIQNERDMLEKNVTIPLASLPRLLAVQ